MAYNILLVDDDKDIRECLELDLHFSGYNVTAAADGQEGLQKAINGDYCLIILDVMMPKIDGFTIYSLLGMFSMFCKFLMMAKCQNNPITHNILLSFQQKRIT